MWVFVDTERGRWVVGSSIFWGVPNIDDIILCSFGHSKQYENILALLLTPTQVIK